MTNRSQVLLVVDKEAFVDVQLSFIEHLLDLLISLSCTCLWSDNREPLDDGLVRDLTGLVTALYGGN